MTIRLKQVDTVIHQHIYEPHSNHKSNPPIDTQKVKRNTSILLKKINKPQGNKKKRKNEQRRTTKTTGKQVIKWQ